jgi:RNA polymerase sigma-70 factor (ECF subfamily)
MHQAPALPAPFPATETTSTVSRPVSFEDFYARSRTNLGRALTLALGDIDLAAEAIDEAYARAYERWATVGTIDRPEAWVYRVAMNWSLSVLRRRRRGHHRFYDPSAQHVDPPGTTALEPAIDEALQALDAKHRAVIVCRHFLGWSVAETATALGIREGTVKSRLHRATSILQAHLAHLRTPEDLS